MYANDVIDEHPLKWFEKHQNMEFGTAPRTKLAEHLIQFYHEISEGEYNGFKDFTTDKE